jgi:NAD(P)H-dependent FMN reductase
MPKIAIISASVREGRKSHRVAQYLERYITNVEGLEVDVLDLMEFGFPLFPERLKFMKDPAANIVDFANRVKQADGVIIVTPEYNGGAPASLKNVLDLLTEDWKNKPIAISTVSGGNFGGAQTLVSLLFNFWKIRGWVVPGPLQVPNVGDNFNESCEPVDKEAWDKRAKVFLDGLVWAIEAKKRMDMGA